MRRRLNRRAKARRPSLQNAAENGSAELEEDSQALKAEPKETTEQNKATVPINLDGGPYRWDHITFKIMSQGLPVVMPEGCPLIKGE